MQPQIAHPDDIPPWLELAAEVEPLFGPLVSDPSFNRALLKCIGRGTALVGREDDAEPGAPLLGGLLFSPTHEIGWLAVAEQARRMGVGRRLVAEMLRWVLPLPALIRVQTFAAGVEGGEPARDFYEQLGFEPGEAAPINPAGLPTQFYYLHLNYLPTVRAVLEHDGRYLLVQHNNIRPENIGKWGLPGGILSPTDPGWEACLRREMGEEFQIEIAIERFIRAYMRRERLHYVYLAHPLSLDLHCDRNEVLDTTWLTAEEVSAWDAAGKLHTGFELPAIRTVQNR